MGSTVDIMPKDKPPIIMVADPVSEGDASFLVGLYESDVKYSVDCPISTPATSPASMEK